MDEKTIHTYNYMAKEYDDETIGFWDEFPRTFFDAFAALVHDSVLDVGSGPGRDGLLLKERGLNVTCLDASEAMISMCKERGLNGIVADFNELPFDDGTFEGVWAYTSLLHVPKQGIVGPLQEIARVLKKDGVFGLGMIEGDFDGYRESAGVNMPRWFSFYTKEEIETLLGQNGFTIVHFEEFKPRSKNYLNFIARKK